MPVTCLEACRLTRCFCGVPPGSFGAGPVMWVTRGEPATRRLQTLVDDMNVGFLASLTAGQTALLTHGCITLAMRCFTLSMPPEGRFCSTDARCGHVQVGDILWVTGPSGTGLITDTVLAVERVLAEGMFNPYTDQGARDATDDVVHGDVVELQLQASGSGLICSVVVRWFP